MQDTDKFLKIVYAFPWAKQASFCINLAEKALNILEQKCKVDSCFANERATCERLQGLINLC